MNLARAERAALARSLLDVGPDAPTLCDGWTAADLAAHLVVRERRPDAAAGIMIPALAGRTRRVQEATRRRYGFERLVELVRTGPPRLSPWRLPGADAAANTVEYFIHHEDVRRAGPEWVPRDLPAGVEDALWRRLRLARLAMRRLPLGVVFQRTDGDQARQPGKPGEPRVLVRGRPSELLLWSAGRTGAAKVSVEGEEAALATLTRSHWGL